MINILKYNHEEPGTWAKGAENNYWRKQFKGVLYNHR
jgi:hypothetical protein